jgi:tetratricopeptide (TPR) repeat protein
MNQKEPSEREWEDRIRETLDAEGGASARNMADIEAAICEHPRSARLWELRGDVIQLLGEPLETYDLPEALRSYQHAVELDPQYARAHEAIGHYLDAVEDHPAQAEGWFRRALERGDSSSAWSGLARVLAQLGRRAEAIQLLESCPQAADPAVQEVREEIERGEWDP